MKIDLRWGQAGSEPYLVPVPRIPVVGEFIVGPDDTGTLEIVSVTYVYEQGFHFDPTRVVVEARPVSNTDSGSGNA